jgi:hypothetical protein
MDLGFGLENDFTGHSQLLITIYLVIFLFLTSAVHCSTPLSSPVLWFRLPMADIPLPLGSRTVPVHQPQQLLIRSELNGNLTPIVISHNPLLRLLRNV